MSCGVGCIRGSDPKLLMVRHRMAAVALIRLLAWELMPQVWPLKRKKKKNVAIDLNIPSIHLPLSLLTLIKIYILEFLLWLSGNEPN